MKTTFKVFVYGEEVFSGTLDMAVRVAQKENKKINMSVAKIEIWNKDKDYWLADVAKFW